MRTFTPMMSGTDCSNQGKKYLKCFDLQTPQSNKANEPCHYQGQGFVISFNLSYICSINQSQYICLSVYSQMHSLFASSLVFWGQFERPPPLGTLKPPACPKGKKFIEAARPPQLIH